MPKSHSLLIVCCYFLWPISAVAADDPLPNAAPADVARLCSMWEAQAKEITSASIKYKCLITGYHRDEVPKIDLSRERVTKVIDAANPIVNPTNIKTLLADLQLPNAKWDQEPWSASLITVDGAKWREDSIYKGQVQFSSAFDGTNDLQFQLPNKQYQIFDKQKARRPARTANSIRFIPTVPAERRKEMQSIVGPDGVIQLTAKGMEIVADRETGFVRSARLGTQALILQREPIECGEHIWFPKLFVDARFVRNRLSTIEIYLVDTIKINCKIDEHAFVFSAPKGFVIFDERAAYCGSYTTTQQVDNIVTFANSMDAAAEEAERSAVEEAQR